jgi:hypothetical protein
MSEEFGVDIEKAFHAIDSSEVLVIRFHFIEKRLLADFRTRQNIAPLVQVVDKAESAEDRFRSIKKLRPSLPFPERVNALHFPRHIGTFVASGIWPHLVVRMVALGGDDAAAQCARALEELMTEERKETASAITGAQHYQTLWERKNA